MNVRDIRNADQHLVCRVNDATGEVTMAGTHKSQYGLFLSTGEFITVERGGVVSTITRTESSFEVVNRTVI